MYNLALRRLIPTVNIGLSIAFAIVSAVVVGLAQNSSNPPTLSLQQITGIHGGHNQWTRIAIVSGGKMRWLRNEEFRPNSPDIILGSQDLVVFDESAEALREWSVAHPSENISLDVLLALPKRKIFRADGNQLMVPSPARAISKPDSTAASRLAPSSPVTPPPSASPTPSVLRTETSVPFASLTPSMLRTRAPALNSEQRVPIWPWTVAIAVFIVIVVLKLKRRI